MENIKLGDICTKVCSGGTPTSSNPAYYNGDIPWLNTNEVNFCNIYSTNKTISEEGLKESAAKYVPQNTIIVAMYGVTAGKCAIAKIPLTTNQACCNLVIDKKKADYRYVYYFLKQQSECLNRLAIGGAQQNLNAITIRKYKIALPPLPLQQKIASILSAYDTLIENNTRRIRLLEQMAENLYKEWFVRFRFPGHENVEMVKSKYGRVPSNFNIIKMQEAFDYYIGGGWGQEEQTNDFSVQASVIRGTDFPKVRQYDISTCPRRFHKKRNYQARQLEDGDIIMEISGGTSEQPVGRVALITQEIIDRFEDSKVICASFCKLIRLQMNLVSPYFFYYWMSFLYNTRMITRFQLQSTGIVNFQFESFLRKGEIMLPTMTIMKSFEKRISSIHKQINKLAQQNTLLTRQRDLLLPRLMSGKLEVKP
ncbi:restriction endonuclease subunit S [Alloprevotella tannerae]|jgi:restriction modification system DNA specificity domain protein|uniref:restriction endonuclease subunit S n=1 Tax=Alloprevotella tannerae TaxID=76122 RepID=UPI001EDB5BEB|nr:restriction endonuclease subunit S [Alloprevotella tannerae]MCG2651367.1 restriction endonuclease subunit S [Alloprevotella tannerae]